MSDNPVFRAMDAIFNGGIKIKFDNGHLNGDLSGKTFISEPTRSDPYSRLDYVSFKSEDGESSTKVDMDDLMREMGVKVGGFKIVQGSEE